MNQPVAFYPVFFGTILSIITLSILAFKEYESGQAVTLSRLGGGHRRALQQFRAILWVCGTLFSITVLFFIAPRLHSSAMFGLWIFTYACEIMLGVVPDHKGWQRLWHNIFAYGMALGFLVSSIFFSLSFTGKYQIISAVILFLMLAESG